MKTLNTIKIGMLTVLTIIFSIAVWGNNDSEIRIAKRSKSGKYLLIPD